MQIKQVQGEGGKALESALKNLHNKVCKVGWIDGAKYPVTKYEKNPPFIAEVVASNEFGRPSKNVPARPFVRPTVTREENSWRKIGFEGSKKVLKGQLKVEDVLDLIGARAASDIRKTIRQVWSPALKPSTIYARMHRYAYDTDLAGSTRKKRQKGLKSFTPSGLYKPLIDTGLMFATLAYKVENE